MPTFYSVNGAMLSPEQIANRKAIDNGEDLVFSSKADLVKRVIDLSTTAGKNVSQAQERRYGEMRRDQLDVLISNLSKKPIAKKAPVVEKVEAEVVVEEASKKAKK